MTDLIARSSVERLSCKRISRRNLAEQLCNDSNYRSMLFFTAGGTRRARGFAASTGDVIEQLACLRPRKNLRLLEQYGNHERFEPHR